MANTATVKSAEVFEVSDERNEPMVVPEETKSYLDNMKDALEGIGWIKKYFAGECDIPERYQHKEADKVETSNGANKESSKAEQAKALNASVVEAVEHAFSDDESTLAEAREKLGQYLTQKVSSEMGDIEDEFEKELAMDIMKSVVSTISDCIADPDELKKIDNAFRHNPEEAEKLVLDAMNRALNGQTEKTILKSVEGIFYGKILSNVVKNADWLVDHGFCSDSDTAKAVADQLVNGDFSSLEKLDEMFMDTLRTGLQNVGVDLEETKEVAALMGKHIPDNTPGSSGVIDFSMFGGNKVRIDGNNSQVIQQQQVQRENPVLSNPNFIAAQQQAQLAPPQPVQQVAIGAQQSQNQEVAPGVIAVNPQFPITKIQTKKVPNPADNLTITGAPTPVVQDPPEKVSPDFIQEDKVHVKDAPVSLHDPSNDMLISVYPWLADIEKISNELGQPIKFINIGKINMNEPSGLVQAYVYTTNGQFCEPKSFTIDASGVMYDRRPKFFPVVNPMPGYTYEDYPAYLIFMGGKDNAFNKDTIRAFLVGGREALPQRSAYRPEYYQLNKLVDLSTIPTNLMNSDMRKRVQNRLANAMGIGVFGAALEHDRTSRWGFETFNRKDESFVLTNVGVPYRFNGLCYAIKEVKIHFTSNNEAKITVK